jgi:hypothetical protein
MAPEEESRCYFFEREWIILCGIAGWIDWDDDLTRKGEILESMTERLVHRGRMPAAHGFLSMLF